MSRKRVASQDPPGSWRSGFRLDEHDLVDAMIRHEGLQANLDSQGIGTGSSADEGHIERQDILAGWSPDNSTIRRLVVECESDIPDDVVPVAYLNQWFSFELAQRDAVQGLPPSKLAVVCPDMNPLIDHVKLTNRHLMLIARCHGVYGTNHWDKARLKAEIKSHCEAGCTILCANTYYIFRALPRERSRLPSSRVSYRKDAIAVPSSGVSYDPVENECDEERVDELEGASTFPIECPPLQRESIIAEFQEYIDHKNWVYKPCATCGQKKYPDDLSTRAFESFPFNLLTNDGIPEHLSPVTYDFNLYGRAFLCADALTEPFACGPLDVCGKCMKALEKGKMPLDALANYLYFAHECLPKDIQDAFAASSAHERQLIAGCRATNMTYTYKVVENDSRQRKLASRKYTKGNVAIIPQDLSRLADVLPSAPSDSGYMMCVIFIGGTEPTWENITELNPVLVSRSRVEILARFVVSNNTVLQADGVRFSKKNLDALCPPSQFRGDRGFSSAIEIVYLPGGDRVADAATSGYGEKPGVEKQRHGVSPQDLLIDVAGFAQENESWVGRDPVSRLAIQWCRQYRPFLAVKGGRRLFSERDYRLLSYLFPHLDPWGIGGFNNPLRKSEHRISMRRQLRNMLRLWNGPFERDYNFVFVMWNIVQKLENSRAAMFSVKERLYKEVADDLVTHLTDMEAMVKKWTEQPDSKPGSQSEQKILQMVNKLKAISRDLPGSNAGRLRMRNEIRGLLKTHGCPAFFITFTPADVYHKLPYLLSGKDEELFSGLDEVELARIVADNPSAAADFFDIMVRGFISTILRYGDDRPGLFGKCTAYYATVEAQGRGTLHTHMVIWLEGSPNPQELRDRLRTSPDFARRMITWLESIIRCELPGDTQAVKDPPDRVKKPKKETARDPRSMPFPQRKHFSSDAAGSEAFGEEFEDFVRQLVKACNWHSHTSTCWKYLTSSQLEIDQNCRMRLPADIQESTQIDPDKHTVNLRRLHPWIGNYNETMMFLLQCNMDIKHISSGEAAKALVCYITDYMSKAQMPIHVVLSAVCVAVKRAVSQVSVGENGDRTRLRQSLLTRVVNGIMGKLELSHQQVMSYLVGGGDHYTSHQFRAMNWGSIERFIREQERGHDNRGIDPDDTGDADEFIQYVSDVAKDTDINADEAANQLDGLFESNGKEHTDDVNQGEESDADPGDGDVEGAIDMETLDAQIHSRSLRSSDLIMTVKGKAIAASSTLLDYLYRGATPEFESLCVWDMVAKVEYISIEEEKTRLEKKKEYVKKDGTAGKARGRRAFTRVPFSSEQHPRFKTHVSRLREVPLVPVVLGPSLPRRDRDEEGWCRAMLILFKPWRSLAGLKNREQTWSSAYEMYQFPDHLKSIMKNIHVELECKDARDQHSLDRRAGKVGSLLYGFSDDSDVQVLADTSLDDALKAAGDDDMYFVPASETTLEGDCVEPERPINGKDVRTQQCLQVLQRAGIIRSVNDVVSNDDMEVEPAFDKPGPELFKKHEAIMRESKRQKRPAALRGPSIGVDDEFGLYQYLARPSTSIHTLVDEMEASVLHDVLDLPPYHPLRRAFVLDELLAKRKIIGNLEQEVAVRLVCEHFIEREVDQMIMLVAGTGGTGKSYVTMTISIFFHLCGLDNAMLRSAPTGIAAVMIEGHTIHALTFLPQPQRQTFTRLAELESLWKDVLYIVIDEVSMISAGFLAKISQRIGLAKGKEHLPFGGVSVIFMGDFGQLAPVRAKALYDWRLYVNVSGRQGQSQAGIDELYGAHLWRQLTHVVCLKKNKRQEEDPQYAELNERIRVGEPILNASELGAETDYTLLHRRLLSEIGKRDPIELEGFRDCPVIVADKQLRDAINLNVVRSKARQQGYTAIYMCARDRAKRRVVSRAVQEKLWTAKSSKTGDLLGALPFFPGMKVMVTENTDMSHLTVNGSEGTLLDVAYETDEWGSHYATCAYVLIPKSGLNMEGLPPNVVPIYPVRRSFRLTLRSTGNKPNFSFNVSREQLPLLPAYAYTDYKSQGRSLENVIVDIASCKDLQSLYVMLSRVKTLKGLALLRRCPYSKFAAMSLRHDARAELQRIDKLHAATMESYLRKRRRL